MNIKQIGGCLVGLIELILFGVVISYPILLVFLWALDRNAK